MGVNRNYTYFGTERDHDALMELLSAATRYFVAAEAVQQQILANMQRTRGGTMPGDYQGPPR